MNLYIIVEGKSGESIVYPKWINIIRPKLKQVYSVGELIGDNYYLISGNGYPNYINTIDSAIVDCNNNSNIDFLVIAVDAEEYTYEEKRTQLFEQIKDKINPNKIKLIIQSPCLETWALGNRIVCRRSPRDIKLKKYIQSYDVRQKDPEYLPSLDPENYNKCQFAFIYLKRILNDRSCHLTYTKSNPMAITHKKYFNRIHDRFTDTGHIKSFNSFMEAFTNID